MDNRKGIVVTGVIILLLVLFLKMEMNEAYDQTSLETRVNITKSIPIINNITINQGAPINLSEGTTYNVSCNVTITNYAGLSDIDKVNATYYRTNYSLWGDADNHTRYFDTNCSWQQNISSIEFIYLCNMSVTYYVYNGSWNCTVFVNSTLNNPANGSNSSFIYQLFAINVTDLIDYGNMAVLDTSTVRTVNVTNWGNMAINLSVYGFGGTDNATGGGLSFICPVGSNITVDNERYTLLGDVSWATMVNLTSGPKIIENLTIVRQTNDTLSYNTTYWKLYIPPNPYGYCNGTVVYEALGLGE